MHVACTDMAAGWTIFTASAGGPACEVVDSTNLNTAMSDLTGVVFPDAMIQAADEVLNIGTTTDIGDAARGGAALAAGTYRFSGANINVNIATLLTLNGSATDVWIFQIPGTLNVSANVVLTGTALPKNVFWAVGKSTTIFPNFTMQGTILGTEYVAMQDGATLLGRAFSMTDQVTLLRNTITKPPVVLPGPAVLNARLNVNKTKITIGQAVQLVLSVTNVGGSSALNIKTQAWSSSPYPSTGPAPVTLGVLTEGSKAMFTWTATPTAAGFYVFTATATADGPISSLKPIANVTVQTPPAISATLSAASAGVIGGTFMLTLSVSNSGQASAWVALTTTAFRVSVAEAAVRTYVGPTPAMPYLLAQGAKVVFTYTASAGSIGTGITISNTLYVTDANSGLARPSIVVRAERVSVVLGTPLGTPVAHLDAHASFIYPSPTSGNATIAYEMRAAGTVKIRVYNSSGQLAVMLEEHKPEGLQSTPITTSRLAPGVYFYMLTRTYDAFGTDKIKVGPIKFVVAR
jgi:hypothetical protein